MNLRLCMICLGIPLTLSGCQSLPTQSSIPESLLVPCEAPAVNPSTNAGLLNGLIAYDAALRRCNDDKAAIREHLKEN